MKKKYLFLILFVFVMSLNAQFNYYEAIAQGDFAFKNGEYEKAFNKYSIAENFDPSKKEEVRKRITKVFKETDSLRIKAENAKKLTIKALEEKVEASKKNDKLIEAFYFNYDKFALAYKNEKYYYINKNGEDVQKLGKWDKADQFDALTGLAKVISSAKINYLLDTTGNCYRYTCDLKKQLEEVDALDLSYQGYDKFPLEQIWISSTLKILILNGNQISELPKKIDEFVNLKVLVLRDNQLTVLAKEICNLKNLSVLSFRDNKLTALPKEICELKKLVNIDLSNNKLTNMPEKIGELKNLEAFFFRGNQLAVLPKEIRELKKLIELDLSFNQLTNLPKEISELKKLVKLDLSFNQLTNLPKDIGELKNLTGLNLNFNQLTSLPNEICELKDLTELNISNNPINDKELQKIKEMLPNVKINFNKKATNDSNNIIYKEALDYYSNKSNNINIKPSIDLYGNIGVINRLLGDYQNAIEYFNRCLEIDPNNVWTMKQLCKTFSDKKDYKSAYSFGKKLIEKDGDNYENWYNLSYSSLFVGKPNEAIRYAQESISLNSKKKSIESYLALGYLLNNQWGEAEKIYLRWKGKKFPSEEMQCDKMFLADIKDLEEAKITNVNFEKVKKILTDDTYKPPLDFFQLGLDAFKNKQYRDALNAYLLDIEVEKNNIRSYRYVGLCYQLLEEHSKANEYFNIYLGLNPTNIKAIEEVRISCHKMRDYNTAYLCCEKLCELDSTNFNHWFDLSFYSLFVGKPNEAITFAQKTLELNSGKNEVETNLALGYLLNNQWDEAEEIYLKWKGKKFPNDERLCDNMFLADIKDLEDFGITHNDFEKVKELFNIK
ncbi:MAG: tetratricopeptide repeat protein [bacterium]